MPLPCRRFTNKYSLLWLAAGFLVYSLAEAFYLEVSSRARRRLFASVAVATSSTWSTLNRPSNAEEGVSLNFADRDRKGNKDGLIREDYWYMTGKLPPRRLESALKGDDPQWNAFGSCESKVKGEGNPCTYVSLKQRVPAYGKYASSIAAGAKDMQKLGAVLQKIAKQPSDADLWEQAASYVVKESGSVPPPLVDAELKMILFGTAMTTSPNFPIPPKELLVARFYSNECHYASTELSDAILNRDILRAIQAWEFGRDSWNSYFKVINPSISPKVGDKFEPIS